jgi:hypothetical protein
MIIQKVQLIKKFDSKQYLLLNYLTIQMQQIICDYLTQN